MSFMKPYIYEAGYYLVETTDGTYCVPDFVVGATGTILAENFVDYVEGEIEDPYEPVERHVGFVGRMSASGYLDCTDWVYGSSLNDVEQQLEDLYGEEF